MQNPPPHKGHRVELNVTLECNLSCPGCNRLCGRGAPSEHMSVEQIDAFCKWACFHPVSRVKIAGGESLKWNRFTIGFVLLEHASKQGIFSLCGNTNGTLPMPSFAKGVKWYYSSPRKKRHLPYWHAPIDLGLSWKPCKMPHRCGFSLDPGGWLPCSPAIMIARVFGMTDLYRSDLPDWKTWGMDRLCPLCPHAAPEDWRREHCKPLSQFTDEDNTPSASWAKALDAYGS